MMPCLSCELKSSLSCHLPHYSCRGNVNVDKVVWQVLHEDEEEDDDEGQEKSKEQPYVDDFHVRRRWEFRGHRLVQGVHHQHARDRHRDAGLEVFLLEVGGRLCRRSVSICRDIFRKET